MIEISNLTKSYAKSDFLAVKNLSLTVNAGDICGFIGPNGAGKSTTIKCMTGILPITSGSVSICGVNLKDNPKEAKKNIGYVADEHILYDGLTGIEYINFIADVFNIPNNVRKERAESIAARFDMSDKLNDKISTYSHGMKQKISIIATLVHEPPVWILDEPLTGLDPKASFELKQMMLEHAQNGKVVFFSSHVLEVVEKLCTRIAVINKGEIILDCGMAQLKERQKDMSLEQLFLGITGGA